MTYVALDNYVRVNAPKFMRIRPDPPLPAGDSSKSQSSKRVKPKPPLTGGIYSSYTHTEVSDMEIAQGLCALVGAFFIKCGTSGSLKVLDWLEFRIPDINGEEQNIATSNHLIPVETPVEQAPYLPHIIRLLPHASELENKLGYT